MTSKFALSLTHTALDGLLAISLLLVLIALFTPAWRLVAFVGHSSSGTVVDGTVSFGVTMSTCGGSFSSSQGCLKWNVSHYK